MSASVDVRIDGQLEEAWARGSCYVPFTRNDRAALSYRVTAGKGIVSPFPGLFARESDWSKLKYAYDKAPYVIRGLAQLHPDWTFSHVSAAVVHGLQVTGTASETIHIISENRSAGPKGVVKHVASREEKDECRVVSGVSVTSFWQTVFDCLRTLPPNEALVVADSALRLSGLAARDLMRLLRKKYRGRPGLNAAIKVARFADGRSENGGESMARAAMIKLGFEVPDLQGVLDDPLGKKGAYRVDYIWWGADFHPQIIGELDGYCKTEDARYRNGRSVERVLADNRRRESRVSAHGAGIMRFSFDEASDKLFFGRLLDVYGVPRRNTGHVCTHREKMNLGSVRTLVSRYELIGMRLYPSDLEAFKNETQFAVRDSESDFCPLPA